MWISDQLRDALEYFSMLVHEKTNMILITALADTQWDFQIKCMIEVINNDL